MNLIRFNGRKIIKVEVENVGGMIAYNVYRTYWDDKFKNYLIPAPKKGEVVAVFDVVWGSDDIGKKATSIVYFHKRYLVKDGYGHIVVDPKVEELIKEFFNKTKVSTNMWVVKPTREHKIELLGKIFLMKDENSFISEDQTIEMSVGTYENYGENTLKINGVEIPTRVASFEHQGGGASFNNWYLTERLALATVVTNTELPCKFRLSEKYTQGIKWIEDKEYILEDELFSVKIKCYFDSEEEYQSGDGECFSRDIKWKF